MAARFAAACFILSSALAVEGANEERAVARARLISAEESDTPVTAAGRRTSGPETERPPRPSNTPPASSPSTPGDWNPIPPRVLEATTWAYDASLARRGLHVAVRVGDGSHVEAVLAEPYNGSAAADAESWLVHNGAEKYVWAAAGNMRVRAAKGMQVVVDEDEPGTISGVDSATLGIQVLLHSGEERGYDVSRLAPSAVPPVFAAGDPVQVRNKPTGAWKAGVVTATQPSVLVLAAGLKKPFNFAEIRYPRSKADATQAPDTAEEAIYEVGTRIEVRDSSKAPWRSGTVSSTDKGTWVHVHGWKSAYRWKYMRPAAAAPTAEASEAIISAELQQPSTADKLAAINKIWAQVCAQATCAAARLLDDLECSEEYVCGNSSGCTWDDLEEQKCRVKFKVGDSVQLAPGMHEQGSVQQGEVGVISAVFEDELQPIEVRGGYATDTYRFAETEIVPAWGPFVRWIDPRFLNPTLASWRGRASFGAEAERVEGATVNLGLRTPAPWGWDPVPVAPSTPPADPSSADEEPDHSPQLRATTPPRAIPTLPPRAIPPPPPREATAAAPVRRLAPPPEAPTPPLRPTLRLTPKTAKPAPPPPTAQPPAPKPSQTISHLKKAVQKIDPPTRPPGSVDVKKLTLAVVAKALLVSVPDMPEVCGLYKNLPRKEWVRDAPVFHSADCATGDCVLFLSHGGFWMIGRHKADAAGNRGIVKSSEKVPPRAGRRVTANKMEHWEYLGSAGWVATEAVVDEPESPAAKGISLTDPCGKNAPDKNAASGDSSPAVDKNLVDKNTRPNAGVEKRLDLDGNYYTKDEFLEYHKSNDAWVAQASTSKMM
ncbi:hypothetical protein DIPPA_35403 [Diplonema papillatum]|nr:hypothetical protein DIPPA_35403 [Diplonema papillatum]